MRPPVERTLGALLESAAATAEPEQGIRLLDRRERGELTPWAEIAKRAEEVGRRLLALGVRRGDRVAIIYPTSLEFFDAFFGTLAAGGVPTPLYPPVRLGRLPEYHEQTARMISAAGARVVLADGGVRRILGETIQRSRPELGCRTLAELPPSTSNGATVGKTTTGQPEELAMVQFSSGTTVDPKPVALTQRAIVAQVEALNSFWPDDETIRHSGVSWLPLYHDMGLIGCIFTALERKATITLLPPEAFVTRPAIWLRTLSRFHATISPAPNFAYGLAVEKIRDEELEGCDLSSWHVALNGAESVAPAVLRAFSDRFARWGFRHEALTPVYGLSEAALAVTFSPLHTSFRSVRFDRVELAEAQRAVPATGAPTVECRELVSVGQPLPGFAIEVRGPTGDPLPDGDVGRIWVRGPSLMDGYLDQPEPTARAVVRGWLDTGDLGFLFDGELFLAGRVKDLVILRGRNYAPEGIEHAVDSLPSVRTGCSVAVGHLAEGSDSESLWLFVERAKRNEREDDDAIASECRAAVLAATGLRPEQITILEPGTLPRTSSGKLRRGETLRRYLASDLTPGERVGPLSMLRWMARSRRALRRAERAPTVDVARVEDSSKPRESSP